MADEKRRVLELFYILAKQNDFISSIELAQLVKVILKLKTGGK